MKKPFSILLLLCLICLFTSGCSKEDASQKAVPESIPENNYTEKSGTESSNTEISDIITEDISIDVDLTALSSTMVYAEVYNIMINPDDYMGKTIKMSGPYYAMYYDETAQYYHYVIVEDATACCTQGLEFIWKGEHVYPEDYPEDQTIVEVTGVFESYEELGQTYYYLSVDNINYL